jgi:chromatin remodeling complex protein RSC6
MVRITKSDKQSASASASSTLAPASVPALSAPLSAPVAEKSLSSSENTVKKTKKVKAVSETAPAEGLAIVPETTLLNEVVEVAPVEVVSIEAAPVDSSSALVKINEFSAKLQQLTNLFSIIKNDFKTLEKVIIRDLKQAQKSKGGKKKATGNRQPSGFVKPTLITEELANFLGKKVGTEMARTEVSKEINQYIRTHNLQDKANGRKINADTKLSALLKLNAGDELTYFNLQRYMKHHFIKTDATAVVTETA